VRESVDVTDGGSGVSLPEDPVALEQGERLVGPSTPLGGAPPSEAQPTILNRAIGRALRSKHPAVIATLAFLTIPLGLVVMGYVWFWVLPTIYRWGFEPLTWHAILSVIALPVVALLSILPPYLAGSLAYAFVAQWASEQERADTQTIRDASDKQTVLEEEIEQRDPDGLVPLIRYSRIELEKYYATSLSQTQRSFRYSIIAMWLGFALIAAGLAFAFGWQAFGLTEPPTNVNFLVVGAGILVEFISALFLWVYRKTIDSFRYYYNRQMHMHNVLLCARLAGSMKDGDETRKLIVDRILAATWTIDDTGAPPGAKGLKELVT